MTVQSLPDAATREAIARLDASLHTVLPVLEEQAQEGENLGHLTDTAVAAMRDAGYYSMIFPREVGGAEIPAVRGLYYLERLSHAHASAGWCASVNNAEGVTMALYIAQSGLRDIFAQGPHVTIAGSGVPRGYAREVEGGFMIIGDWAYGSAIYHADWIHSGCFVRKDGQIETDAEGKPRIIIAHHPRNTITLQGNWDVLGLRATGSFDYHAVNNQEIFVPAERCYEFNISDPLRGGKQGYLGLAGYTAWAHTGWALGVGRRILDETRAVILARRDLFGQASDSATLRYRYAQAETAYRAARAYAYSVWQDVQTQCDRDLPPTCQHVTQTKLALRHVHDMISDVGTFCYRISRGAGLHKTLLQRVYRDIHSGTQHILMADQVIEECGRDLLGLTAPNARWAVFGIDG
ncbi:hypothetical protein K2X14_08940 [Acetobacter sp. TBRC 12305]|uniref:Acyl-CoA dehydrogenase C-terminal domain-containing protein n=1 Tax=Acetobacter garciniae TaxID=2817435 RepID=A0A939HP33_9PROT|nr:hypothetical protein [Acetobacter garciniae]MBO1325072.1 hypothetical protein [Acetobacter garciniae]MBX0344957.1 hypothetical protein [Acetobacter garciniae]